MEELNFPSVQPKTTTINMLKENTKKLQHRQQKEHYSFVVKKKKRQKGTMDIFNKVIL